MTPITVVARLKAKQENVAAVEEELRRMVAPTRLEPGCLEYLLHRDSEDPSIFVFYEIWESAAAVAGHKETEHYRHYAATVFDLLEERVVHKLARIA